jgi:hypothetical protein
MLHTSFVHAEESKYKFTLGSNLGGFPLEINKMSKNIKTMPGIQINSWNLSPNFSSLVGKKKSSKFPENKISKDNIYLKFNLRF